MFKKIREANPSLPIIIMPRPKFRLSRDEQTRFEIIKKTYQNAVDSGDKNVYLIFQHAEEIGKGGATCADVLSLMEQVSDMVFEKFGVRLEPEVKILK